MTCHRQKSKRIKKTYQFTHFLLVGDVLQKSCQGALEGRVKGNSRHCRPDDAADLLREIIYADGGGLQ